MPWKDQLCLTVWTYGVELYGANSGAAGDRLFPHPPTPPPQVPGGIHLECHSAEVNWVAVAYLCPGPMIPGDIYNLGMKGILVFMSWALRKMGLTVSPNNILGITYVDDIFLGEIFLNTWKIMP